jgi:hypothetical protein
MKVFYSCVKAVLIGPGVVIITLFLNILNLQFSYEWETDVSSDRSQLLVNICKARYFSRCKVGKQRLLTGTCFEPNPPLSETEFSFAKFSDDI